MSKSVAARNRTRSNARKSSPMASKQPAKRRVQTNIPTVGCLFSAMGGFAAAFKRSGANVVWANDKDAHAVETFRHNFPDIDCIHKPIEEATAANDGLQPVRRRVPATNRMPVS